MESVVKTIYHTELMLSHIKGSTFTPLPNTTLNEKFNILEDGVNEDVPNPTLKYFCIGNGNIRTLDTDDDITLHYGNHNVIDGALYNHIPFITRKLTEDIGIDDKLLYRLRKIHVIDGIEYVAYYMKLIPDNKVSSRILKITSEYDTMPKIEEYNYNDSKILNPVPTEDTVNIEDTSTTYVTCSDQITLTLNNTEISEINNAIEVLKLNADNNNNTINEIALCTGSDFLNTSDYTMEVIKAQVMFFVDSDYDLQTLLNVDGHIEREIEVGGMQPFSLKY